MSRYEGGDWTKADYTKKLDDTREVRDKAKQEFLAQRRQQEQERERREAREQAERDRSCWECKELDHRPGNDLLMLCDGDDCMNASHVECNDPPLPGVPKHDVSFLCMPAVSALLVVAWYF